MIFSPYCPAQVEIGYTVKLTQIPRCNGNSNIKKHQNRYDKQKEILTDFFFVTMSFTVIDYDLL